MCQIYPNNHILGPIYQTDKSNQISLMDKGFTDEMVKYKE